jgi:exosortase/archaeosortase family protein
MKEGFKQFLVKTGIFVALFIVIQIATMTITSQTNLPQKIIPIYLVDLAKVGLFIFILFFVAYRKKLFKLKKSKFEIKSLVTFGLLETLALIYYFKFKIFILNNLDIVNAHLHLYQFLVYFALFLTLIFLGLAIFGWNFTRYFIKKFEKEVLIFIGLFLVTYVLSYYVQQSWHYFSFVVAKSVSWLRNLISASTLSFQGNSPIIQFKEFIIEVGAPCSGIESIFLFTVLYLFIACFDWEVFNKKKLALMFIPGLISVFLLNIIRIFLLILLGAYVSPEFSLGLFHTNASWILFLVYFIIFWGLAYNWMKK